jgi:glycosyltransferase involved in cell wall biosynthesis
LVRTGAIDLFVVFPKENHTSHPYRATVIAKLPKPRTAPGETFMPLRVLYLDHTAKIGGGEIALVNLLRHLDRSLVFPIALLFMEGPLRERLMGCCDTHVIPLADSALTANKDGLGWRSLLQLRASLSVLLQIWRVVRFAQKMEIDLIHTNSLKADIIGGIAARIAGIPVVWHVRDRIEADYLPKIVVRVFRFLSQNLPDFVIANSSATLDTLHLNRRRNSAAVDAYGRVVHDGCNVVSIKDESDGSNEATVRIGLVGRISPWKGQDIFIKAAALLKQKHPEAKFEIIGAPLFSERAYEAELHKLCDELKVNDTVEFAGFVENMPARIAALDIVVHASTTGEPFGQVIIEGMAGQKPVVATNGGGVPEIVQDGVTGLLVPMGDAPRMAEAIDYLLTHRVEATEMGLRGRERVQTHFTIQKTARMVEEVYGEVFGRPLAG